MNTTMKARLGALEAQQRAYTAAEALDKVMEVLPKMGIRDASREEAGAALADAFEALDYKDEACAVREHLARGKR